MSRPECADPTAPPGTYWIDTGTLLAGAYPGHREPGIACARVGRLLDLGIDWFIDLTMPGELPDYRVWLPSAGDPARPPVMHSRRPIADHGVPAQPRMVEILDELEAAHAAGRRVYVHCRAGIGRTGTVIGCLLARRVGDGEVALATLARRWLEGGRLRDWPQTPETDAQRDYVRRWCEPRALPAGLRNRYRGLLQGLALGEALAAPVQHRRPGSFTPVTDLLGGGAYDLPRGAWTDDTALALVAADSLLACGRFDARDFIARAQRWQRDGYRSATGQCLGISAATAQALAQGYGVQPTGPQPPPHPDKEPMVRAGVVAAWGRADPESAIALASEAARPTHSAPATLDACRYFAALVVGALRGAGRSELIAPHFTPVPGLWQRWPLRPEVAAVAAGSWREPGAGGSGPVADGTAPDALGLVLWALAGGRSYRDTVLAAVNLGLDADTHGALAGGLAGALYGAPALPAAWVSGLALGEDIAATADRLLAAAQERAATV